MLKSPLEFARMLFASLLIGLSGAAFAQPVSLQPLNPPQSVENDGKIEVLEFFAYGCIVCANAEPRVKAWVAAQGADIKFRQVPSPVPVRGIDSVPIFYTLEAMGQLNRLHQKIFDAANVENVQLGHPPTLLKWLDKNGVKPADFETMQKSFSVDSRIKRAVRMVKDYQVGSTPTFVIDGRWSVVGLGPETFEKIDQAVAQARARMKAAAPATPAVADAKKK
jgi:thiol:disulfide interchange protein DsbA